MPCLHSVGAPLAEGEDDVPWPCNDEKYIVHFPETREIWSFGSGYGGNALLGKKCFALRIASVMARDEGWLAEHMLILKLTSPDGRVKHVAGAFPSACGKTNLAMLIPTMPGWKVETVGDDIAWMKFGDDGRLYAINPEAGFFGVAPGTGRRDEPERDGHAAGELDLHQLRPHRRRRRVVGGHDRRAARSTPSTGRASDWTPESDDARGAPERALHGAGGAVPVDRARVGGPEGRADLGDPLRRPPRDDGAARDRGVRLGARRVPRLDHGAPRRPPRPRATVGELRRDPFAMLPFCGYNMADYFGHWLEIGERRGAPKLPKIFRSTGSARTPTASSCGRASARTAACSRGSSSAATTQAEAVETPIGLLPAATPSTPRASTWPRRRSRAARGSTPRTGASSSPADEHFAQFGDRLPEELERQLNALEERLT